MKNYKFSIITPTHRPHEYLNALWESIKEQTYDKWEWILYLNGGMHERFLSEEIRNDKRVTIHKQDVEFTIIYKGRRHRNIGYIKNEAFNLGKGDILVEADHDDMLDKDCLKELNKAFQFNAIGFVYSDNATMGLRKPFIDWEWYYYDYKGMKLISVKQPELNADNVASMWYAPNHVRAWRKTLYKKLGGHDKDLNVCDDLDLIIRTYLNTKIKYIPKTLYIYRLTGNNSFMQYGTEIVNMTRVIREKYKEQLK